MEDCAKDGIGGFELLWAYSGYQFAVELLDHRYDGVGVRFARLVEPHLNGAPVVFVAGGYDQTAGLEAVDDLAGGLAGDAQGLAHTGDRQRCPGQGPDDGCVAPAVVVIAEPGDAFCHLRQPALAGKSE